MVGLNGRVMANQLDVLKHYVLYNIRPKPAGGSLRDPLGMESNNIIIALPCQHIAQEIRMLLTVAAAYQAIGADVR